jgi:hypothetical protein
MCEVSLVIFVDEDELDGNEERSMLDEELIDEDPVPSMQPLLLLLLLLLLSFFWELFELLCVNCDCFDFDCWELRLREDWLDDKDRASEMIEAVSGESCLLVFLST